MTTQTAQSILFRDYRPDNVVLEKVNAQRPLTLKLFDAGIARQAKTKRVKLARPRSTRQNWKTPIIKRVPQTIFFKSMQVVLQELVKEHGVEIASQMVCGYPRYSDVDKASGDYIPSIKKCETEIKNLAEQDSSREAKRDAKRPLVRTLLKERGFIS
jgi:hypothetical protein